SIVGGSIAYVKDGRFLARHDTGFADRSGGIPISPRSIFHYGSITKTLTAVAVLQLRDRGLLSLDDPITRWVPELRQVERALTRPSGLLGRPWLRNLIFASDRDNGYADVALPTIVEAWRDGDTDLTASETADLVDRLTDAATRLSEAATLIKGT
ncbi:MAG TPA: serine hydrolase, partial [Gemmatimonadales bacterium]|nr:serine hydrolase [Gemmatimonadales bacterium]